MIAMTISLFRDKERSQVAVPAVDHLTQSHCTCAKATAFFSILNWICIGTVLCPLAGKFLVVSLATMSGWVHSRNIYKCCIGHYYSQGHLSQAGAPYKPDTEAYIANNPRCSWPTTTVLQKSNHPVQYHKHHIVWTGPLSLQKLHKYGNSSFPILGVHIHVVAFLHQAS
jgi:hypothetical protein